MSLSIISHPQICRPVLPQSQNRLFISEFFCDSIQGENFVGYPAAFLRLQGCTLRCNWCDSYAVWKQGNPYSFTELFELMEKAYLPLKLREGQHLVLTGGSPLKQQDTLTRFLREFDLMYSFVPFVEVENECVLLPNKEFNMYVDCWNNSPKLSNSGVPKRLRYNPIILEYMSSLENSWFKFVIDADCDWQEIVEDFIKPGLIRKDQVVLMPLASTRKVLEINREFVVKVAIENNVRYSTREHIELWDKTIGV